MLAWWVCATVGRRAAHTPQAFPAYLTGWTCSEVVALLEQVENFFLMITAVLALGGNTFNPAAVTGWHLLVEKLPVSTIPIVALFCLPGASVTVPNFEPLRSAALPICLPLLVTAETPG